MQTWPIQDAKSRFSELIDKAISQGAQQITRHGKEVALVIANKDYEQLANSDNSLIQTLLNAPRGEELDIARSKEPVRELDL